jgi:hypothetical protein
MITNDDIQIQHVHTHTSKGHVTEIRAVLIPQPMTVVVHGECKSAHELQTELELAGQRMQRELLRRIYTA